MNTDELKAFAQYLFALLQRFEIAFEPDCDLTLFENSGCFTHYSGGGMHISRLPYHEALFSAYETDKYVLSYFPLNSEYSGLSAYKFSLSSDEGSSDHEAVRKASYSFLNHLASEVGEALPEVHAIYCDGGFLAVSSGDRSGLTDTVFKIEEYIRTISETRRHIDRVITAAEASGAKILKEIYSSYEEIGTYRGTSEKMKII